MMLLKFRQRVAEIMYDILYAVLYFIIAVCTPLIYLGVVLYVIIGTLVESTKNYYRENRKLQSNN